MRTTNARVYACVSPAPHDFDNDHMSDISWHDTSGTIAAWLMNGGPFASPDLGTLPASYSIVGQHDFNGDGNADLLWRDCGGNVAMWFMSGPSVSSAAAVGTDQQLDVLGTGDLNGDGKGDMLWRDTTTGTVAIWFMNGATVARTASFGAVPGNWTIVGTDAVATYSGATPRARWGLLIKGRGPAGSLGTVPSNW